MEDKFYLDDFELSLQEQVNQFEMVPTRKVWHGIYNDLHPGNRWPSVMMTFLLVASIVFVGYLNTKSSNLGDAGSAIVTSNSNSLQTNTLLAENHPLNPKRSKDILKEVNGNAVNLQPKSKINFVAGSIVPKNDARSTLGTASKSSTSSSNSSTSSSLKIAVNEYADSKDLAFNLKADKSATNTDILTNDKSGFRSVESIESKMTEGVAESKIDLGQRTESVGNIQLPELNILDKEMADQSTTTVILNKEPLILNIENLSPVQRSATASLKPVKNHNGKIKWTYYVAPFVSTVIFKGDHLQQNSGSSLSLPQVTPKEMKVIHNAALGFEAGIQVSYAVSKKLKATTGLHFTRSGYNITSNIVHPTLSSLMLKNPVTGSIFSRSFATNYGDGTGSSAITLHNYNYQASIPFGFEYQITNNKKYQVNLSASVEPSLVLKADSYLLSSDGKNYVNVPDLLRKWNFSSNFAPFVSFQSDKYTWNVGPSIRYQWLSVYQNSYTVQQHLIDYGIRVSISK